MSHSHCVAGKGPSASSSGLPDRDQKPLRGNQWLIQQVLGSSTPVLVPVYSRDLV